jgi:hypothetical protein
VLFFKPEVKAKKNGKIATTATAQRQKMARKYAARPPGVRSSMFDKKPRSIAELLPNASRP